MRKHFKNKLRSCALCKPWKRGHSKRWKPQELAKLKEVEKITSLNLPLLSNYDLINYVEDVVDEVECGKLYMT